MPSGSVVCPHGGLSVAGSSAFQARCSGSENSAKIGERLAWSRVSGAAGQQYGVTSNRRTKQRIADRLRLTRATKANLSPIFALYSDPEQRVWKALEAATADPPWGQTVDPDGTVNRVWRVEDPAAIAAVQDATANAELLIADGHHRYETARVYADEIGGEGPHRYVLMCLVALEDPGLTVFPTHSLVRNLNESQWDELRRTIEADFTMTPLDSVDELPPPENEEIELGYIDAREKQPYRLVLRDHAIADARCPIARSRIDASIRR